MKRILLAAAFIAATSTIYANNGETKTTSNSFPNVYYVVALVGSNYQLSDTPPDEPCEGAGEACMITTQQNHDLDLQISPSELNNPSQTTIESRKD